MAYLPVSEEPLVYILGPDSMLFDFRGSYTLIDSGDSPVTLTKHIRQVNCLLTPAPSAKTTQNALHQNKTRLVPVVGSIAGKELSQKLEQHGVPVTVAKQTDKFEPIVLFKSLAEGRLELIVLDGGQKPSLEALQKALDKGDLEATAEKFGMIFVLLWYPAKLNEKVRRILYTGNASTERVILALEKASSLTILQTPSATTGQANAGIPPPPKQNKVAPAKSNGPPAAKPTARLAPAKTSAVAPPKPPTTRAPIQPAKPAATKPPTASAARPARPSTTAVPAPRPVRAAPPKPASAPAKKVAEPAAIKKTVAPVKGAAPSKPTAPAAKKAEPKKPEPKTAPTAKKVAPKDTPKEVSKPAEHVPHVPPVVPSVDSPLVTIAEPPRPDDLDQSNVPVVPAVGRGELVPEVRFIPATPEPPHLDDEPKTPEIPEPHHDIPPVPSAPAEPSAPIEPTPIPPVLPEPIVHPAPIEPEPHPNVHIEPAPGFDLPHEPQPIGDSGLLDDVEAPMQVRKISMDTDLTEEARKFAEEFEKQLNLEANGHPEPPKSTSSALDDLLSGIPLEADQLVHAAIAASLSQTVHHEPPHEEIHKPTPPIHNGGGNHEDEGIDKMKVMQTRSSVVEAGDDHRVYEEPDKALDDVLASVTSQSEQEDVRLSQDDGFKPVDFNELPPQQMHMVLNKIKPSLKNDRYFELVTIPHKGGKCTLENLEEARDFFRTIRSTVYVLASEDIQQFVLDGWLEGKKAWAKPEFSSALYPSVSTPIIQAFTTSHRAEMDQEHMAIHPSIANTNLLIQADEGPEEFKTAKLLL